MQSKGLIQCLQQPITHPSPEPNKSNCHPPSNLFQICWKNQLLVSSCLSICLVQMKQHNFQQTAFCKVLYLKRLHEFINIFKFWLKLKKKKDYMKVYVHVLYCEWSTYQTRFSASYRMRLKIKLYEHYNKHN